MVLDAQPRLAGQDLYQEQVIWDEFNRASGRMAVVS